MQRMWVFQQHLLISTQEYIRLKWHQVMKKLSQYSSVSSSLSSLTFQFPSSRFFLYLGLKTWSLRCVNIQGFLYSGYVFTTFSNIIIALSQRAICNQLLMFVRRCQHLFWASDSIKYVDYVWHPNSGCSCKEDIFPSGRDKTSKWSRGSYMTNWPTNLPLSISTTELVMKTSGLQGIYEW